MNGKNRKASKPSKPKLNPWLRLTRATIYNLRVRNGAASPA